MPLSVGCITNTFESEFSAHTGAAVAPLVWPHASRAQQPGKSIGFLGATTPTIWSPFVGAFLQRLRELGWIDGRNIAIEYRWAEGRDDRYAAFAAEFVQRKVDVIHIAVHESASGRLCCKSRFALVIKNSAGCRRDFRVRT